MEGNEGGNRLTQVHLEKWPLKRSVCVCVFKPLFYSVRLRVLILEVDLKKLGRRQSKQV